MRRRSSKREFLRAAGAWNVRARRVESPVFAQSDFFDPRDKVQVKYEMLRAHEIEGVSVFAACRQFGFSRESFYTTAMALGTKGVVGLADQKRGRKGPHKLTPEVQQFILQEMEKDPTLSGAALAERVATQFSVSVHRRSIERFRSESGKKKRRARRAT